MNWVGIMCQTSIASTINENFSAWSICWAWHQKNAAWVAFMKHFRSVLHQLLLMPEFLSVSDKWIKPYEYLFMHLGVHQLVGCDTLLYVHITWDFPRWLPKMLIFQDQLRHGGLNQIEQNKRCSEHLSKTSFVFLLVVQTSHGSDF